MDEQRLRDQCDLLAELTTELNHHKLLPAPPEKIGTTPTPDVHQTPGGQATTIDTDICINLHLWVTEIWRTHYRTEPLPKKDAIRMLGWLKFRANKICTHRAWAPLHDALDIHIHRASVFTRGHTAVTHTPPAGDIETPHNLQNIGIRLREKGHWINPKRIQQWGYDGLIRVDTRADKPRYYLSDILTQLGENQ